MLGLVMEVRMRNGGVYFMIACVYTVQTTDAVMTGLWEPPSRYRLHLDLR